MDIKILIKKDAYHDSVALMSLSGKLTALAGVVDAVVSMATDMNKELLQRIGLYTDQVGVAGVNDLLIAVRAQDEASCAEAVLFAEEALSKKHGARKKAAIIGRSGGKAYASGQSGHYFCSRAVCSPGSYAGVKK